MLKKCHKIFNEVNIDDTTFQMLKILTFEVLDILVMRMEVRFLTLKVLSLLNGWIQIILLFTKSVFLLLS